MARQIIECKQNDNWRPSVLIAITILIHVTAPLGFVIDYAPWPWLLVVVLINHLVLATLGLAPRNRWLGANLEYLPVTASARNEIALTIDDGPDPDVTPQVLDILDQYQVKATFFCIGSQAARYPELCRAIIERGHAIENHTQHHQHTFSFLGISGYIREIQAAQDTIRQITGNSPRFFRAPAGFRNIFLFMALRILQLHLVSWSVRGFDTYICDANSVRTKLLNGLHPGAILLLHDGNAARTHEQQPIIVSVLPSILLAAKDAKLNFVTLHDACTKQHMN